MYLDLNILNWIFFFFLYCYKRCIYDVWTDSTDVFVLICADIMSFDLSQVMAITFHIFHQLARFPLLSYELCLVVIANVTAFPFDSPLLLLLAKSQAAELLQLCVWTTDFFCSFDSKPLTPSCGLDHLGVYNALILKLVYEDSLENHQGLCG